MPYDGFFSLKTFESTLISKSERRSMYTSSFRSVLRKTFLTFSCCSGQSKFIVVGKRIIIVFNFAIREKVSK